MAGWHPRRQMSLPVSPPPGDVPLLVTVHLWRVSPRNVPAALIRMAADRRRLHRLAGLRFGVLVGTARAGSFSARDADPLHWGLVAAWESDRAAANFDSSAIAGAWSAVADERLLLRLRPLAARGAWAGRAPFGDPKPSPWDGPVAAITHARLRASRTLLFRRAATAVATDLNELARPPRLALGIGESPIGLQGTLSVWDSSRDLTDFAYRRAAHSGVVRRTPQARWYSEELFARFAVLDVQGAYSGRASFGPGTRP